MKLFVKLHAKDNVETIHFLIDESASIKEVLENIFKMTNLKETDSFKIISKEEQIKDYNTNLSKRNILDNDTLTISIDSSKEEFKINQKQKQGDLR